MGPVLIEPTHCRIETTYCNVSSATKGGQLLGVPEDAVGNGGIVHDTRHRLIGVGASNEDLNVNHSAGLRLYNRNVNGHLTATSYDLMRHYNRMGMKEILDRISERSAQLGLSENALSLKAGLSRDGIRNWRRRLERGEEAAGATISALAGVAGALGVSETWLLHGIGEPPAQRAVPVAGRVGAGAQVPLFDTTEDGGLFQVAEPPQLRRLAHLQNLGAVEVEGDSMAPMYQPGDVLFYSRATHEGIPEEAIGRPCIIEDSDGNAWVKQVKRGDEPGLFHLISLNPTSETRHNQQIKWASRVRLALPAEMVERL